MTPSQRRHIDEPYPPPGPWEQFLVVAAICGGLLLLLRAVLG